MYINVQKKAIKTFRYCPSAKSRGAAKQEALANPIYSWHATSFNVCYHHNLLFINDATHLLVLVTDVRIEDYATIQQQFERRLRERLLQLGLDPWQISRYLQSAGPWQVTLPVNEAISAKLNKMVTVFRRQATQEGFESLVAISHGKQELKKQRLFRTNRLYLFIERPLWERQRPNHPNQHLGELNDAVNQLRNLNQRRAELLTLKGVDRDRTVRLIQESNAVLLRHFVQSIGDQYSPRIVRRHHLRLHEHLNHYLADELATILSDDSTSLVELLNHGYPFSEISQTRAALKKLYSFCAGHHLISSHEQRAFQRALTHSFLMIADMPSQQFKKPTYKAPLTTDEEVQVLLTYLERSSRS